MEVWDTSALIAAARDAHVGRILADALAEDAVAVTEPILLEYLNGARNLREYDKYDVTLRATRVLETGPAAWRRALGVHRLLAQSGAGHQRSVRLLDLVIAAVAESHGYRLVHVDQDYERIAALTGQPTRPLALGTGSLAGSVGDKITRRPSDETWSTLRDVAASTPDPDRPTE